MKLLAMLMIAMILAMSSVSYAQQAVGGSKPLTNGLWALIGAVIGSLLTFVAMRRRTPSG